MLIVADRQAAISVSAQHVAVLRCRQRLPIAEVDLEQKLAWVVGDSQQQREQQQQQQQPNLGPPHDGPDQQAGAEAMPQQGASQAGSQRRFSDTPAFLQGRLHPYQVLPAAMLLLGVGHSDLCLKHGGEAAMLPLAVRASVAG